jgi:hypothetical protein
MSTSPRILGLLLLLTATAGAADLPKQLDSSPCIKPPVINGVHGPDEWKNVPVLTFDMPLVSIKPVGLASTPAELVVMNSANNLYVSLRVRDATNDVSLSPLSVDGALLAFCRGKSLARGDDRKAIAAGVYVDKHVTDPGKDADDTLQEGRGAMAYANDWYTFEWAVPLDSGDEEDLRAKLDDLIRFNIAYLDAFPSEKTRMGGLFAGNFNDAATWGTLRLAKDVRDDGNEVFKGLEWADKLLEERAGPAQRLKVIESLSVPARMPAVAKMVATFDYRDPDGRMQTGKAKLFLPHVLSKPGTKAPLMLVAGYESDDGKASAMAMRGWIVATQREVNPNPLIRTTNPDIALLHIVRSLPFVDDARVLISGGSAGGYATLMVAAETFPLAGAAPDVPPVNWGYNAAYFFSQTKLFAPATPGAAPRIPVLHTIAPVLESATKVYGTDYGDETWFRGSPVAHVATITCPVSVLWTTADVLVPIDQIGTKWVKPFDVAQFPEGFAMDPEKLLSSQHGRTRLVDVLSEERYEVFVLQVPAGASRPPVAPGTKLPPPIELPVSKSKQWSIAILDEGPPDPLVAHQKYQLAHTREEFYQRVLSTPLSLEQLTPIKLERLMDRYAGVEWLPTKLKRLDVPESEQADVLRGLKTYTSSSPEHAARFLDLYEKLPSSKRILPADVLAAIQAAGR